MAFSFTPTLIQITSDVSLASAINNNFYICRQIGFGLILTATTKNQKMTLKRTKGCG